MIVGVPREIKIEEYRVGLTPATVRPFVEHGHRVLVEAGAGAGSGFQDDEYAAVGAELVTDAAALFAQAEMIIKVKEPLAEECARLHAGQILYTYLHLAAEPELAQDLLARQVTGIAL